MLAAPMRFSRQVQYAICGLFDLAYNGGGEPVRVRRICERQGVPYRYLEQIFARLRRAGLITGKRGPGGGYVLGRPAEEISLRDVIEAVEGPLGGAAPEAVPDAEPGAGPKSVWAPSPHRPDFLWSQTAERVGELLGSIALADICREAVRRSVERELPDIGDSLMAVRAAIDERHAADGG